MSASETAIRDSLRDLRVALQLGPSIGPKDSIESEIRDIMAEFQGNMELVRECLISFCTQLGIRTTFSEEDNIAETMLKLIGALDNEEPEWKFICHEWSCSLPFKPSDSSYSDLHTFLEEIKKNYEEAVNSQSMLITNLKAEVEVLTQLNEQHLNTLAAMKTSVPSSPEPVPASPRSPSKIPRRGFKGAVNSILVQNRQQQHRKSMGDESNSPSNLSGVEKSPDTLKSNASISHSLEEKESRRPRKAALPQEARGKKSSKFYDVVMAAVAAKKGAESLESAEKQVSESPKSVEKKENDTVREVISTQSVAIQVDTTSEENDVILKQVTQSAMEARRDLEDMQQIMAALESEVALWNSRDMKAVEVQVPDSSVELFEDTYIFSSSDKKERPASWKQDITSMRRSLNSLIDERKVSEKSLESFNRQPPPSVELQLKGETLQRGYNANFKSPVSNRTLQDVFGVDSERVRRLLNLP
jgi:hypothetical protein